MPGEYAAKTDVPVSKSRAGIERTLNRFGAAAFTYMSNVDRQIAISLEVSSSRVIRRMLLPDWAQFRLNSYDNLRSDSLIENDWEQASGQRWRSLAKGVKTTLVLIDDGISTVKVEFLADIVVLSPDQTYGETAILGIVDLYQEQQLSPLTPRSDKGNLSYWVNGQARELG
jgi:hypothetical protein